MSKVKWFMLLTCYSSSLLFYLFQGGRSSVLLFGILNALLLYLLLVSVLGMRKLSGSRTIGSIDQQFMAGQTINITVRLEHRSFIPMPYMKIEDTLIRHNGHIVPHEGLVIPNLFREMEWGYQIKNMKRGIYHFKQLSCSTFDVFGLVEFKRTLKQENQLQVLPRILNNVNWEQLLSGRKGQFHLHSKDRYAKESNQQSGIRDYVHGDRLSRVHWNATARTGQWKSKDFEKEAMPKGIVILDRYLGKPSGKPSSSLEDDAFEALVSISASLLQYGMQQQQLFTLLSPGKELWSSSQFHGTSGYWQAMKHLVTVEPDGERPLSLLLQRAVVELPLASTVMVVTSDATTDMLAAANVLKQKGFLPIVFFSGQSTNKNAGQHRIASQYAYAGIPFYDLSAHMDWSAAAGGEG
ncbi:DUF58 domain-containing protein [Paenibacillus camelliae]|uniref:DUF58 domain-containing protein n=1 Tax=Paenibacillus camelliae TaxID=512410 RepID=UPI0020411BAD|nr:DUF58 domain-containing protein [Paenibacillus camelliae]MCM3632316.1 DUF58 domain-containing protein [Paenibacillus camelliae]